jgi:cbb3-type cytochrome oxidase maturation protein
LISVGVAVLFLAVFIKAVKSGQYDDDYSPAVRILFENSPPPQSSEDKNNQTEK